MNKNIDVVIIDYKLGNLFSVKHACIHVGLTPYVSFDKELIKNAKALILPGVGAFGDAMDNLNKLDLISPIKDFVSSGKPIYGVCLGMQLLFEESEEFGNNKGLGLIKGTINRFPGYFNEKKMRVPHIGWNSIYNANLTIWESSALKNITQNELMYFVHSYYAKPTNENEILTNTNYENFEYCSAILKDNIFATQFHPEKSAKKGIEIYNEWAKKII